MSSEIAVKGDSAIAPISRNEMIAVMARSLYPGAAAESIALVLDYCAAARLDPMQKPVHIVAMWDSKAKCMKDTILPGIGLYRIQAARTGQYAGMSEPVFGPTITAKIGGVEVTYPEWCRITVKRIVGNVIAEFPAVEYWIENYAMKGGAEKSVAPNAMWGRRSFGQLAKCCEAQALRKAFPEVGSAPTAEEMEGKEYQHIEAAIVHQPAAKQPAVSAADAEQREALIARLVAAAPKGLEALTAEFKAIGKEGRQMVGAAEWERIKGTVPVEATIEPEQQKAEEPMTYAAIMHAINEAGDKPTLAVVAGYPMDHLTPEMQRELLTAITKRMGEMK